MRVGILQYESRVGDIDHNLQRLLDAIDRLGPGTDILVTPELYLGGYNAGRQHAGLAQELDGPAISAVSERCTEHGVTAIVGTARAGSSSDIIHNSAVAVTPDGRRTAYDKVHLPTFGIFEEGLHFEPGTDAVVVDTPVARVGLAICYDLFFPELTKRLALNGAEVIVAISASPKQSKPYFETVVPARALETTCTVVYCNLTGPQGELEFWGGSRVVDALGRQLDVLPIYEDTERVVDVDMENVAVARKTRPTLRDTRMFPAE